MPTMEQLKEQARQTARRYGFFNSHKRVGFSFPSLDQDERALMAAHQIVQQVMEGQETLVPAAEWLMDNFYMIEEQVKDIQYCSHIRQFKRLPRIQAGEYRGVPRIYVAAQDLVQVCGERVDRDAIYEYLSAFQETLVLSGEELWVFPLMLKVALVRSIREAAQRVGETCREKERAEYWARQLFDAVKKPELLRQRIEKHNKEVGNLTPAYARFFLQWLKGQGAQAAPILTWADGKLALQGDLAEELIQEEYRRQAADQRQTGNAVTSLRVLSTLKWEDVYESLSEVHHVFSKDPTHVYEEMTFSSREQYRRSAAQMARISRADEVEVAQTALACAQEHEGDPVQGHIGYYLLDAGRDAVRKRLNRSLWIPAHKRERIFAALYVGGNGLLIGLALIALGYGLYRAGLKNAALVGAIILSDVPVSGITIELVQRIITRLTRPRRLPRMDYKEGIPPQGRTMVVIPALLPNERQVRQLIDQIEAAFLGNLDDEILFAVAGDLKDANEQWTPDDDAVIDAGMKAVRDLNEKYTEDGDRFYFFVRERQLNFKQGCWMGWERKRGALMELNRLLLGDRDTGYVVTEGNLDDLGDIHYIITLDTDTRLPRDTAKELIGTLAHPLNQPREGAGVRRGLQRGYGLLQPRIGVAVDSARRSFFTRSFAGQPGIDPYTTAVSDLYQDLFGEGIFTGKGIYDLRTVDQMLGDRFPDNAILSHDLIEGEMIRTALVSDIELIDGYPSHYDAYINRLHRWTRGDWQLLPWLCPRVRNREGKRCKNPLPVLSWFKIVDNLRRSLMIPAQCLLLLWGIAGLGGPALWWLGLSLGSLALPLILSWIDALLAGCGNPKAVQRLRDIFAQSSTLFWQTLLGFVFLAHSALRLADAILRTLYRLMISRKRLLQWITAADAEKRFEGGISEYVRKMLGSMIVGVLAFALCVLNNGALWAAIPVAAAWITAPMVAYRVGLSYREKAYTPTAEEKQFLGQLASETWEFFKTYCTPQEHGLPPDNVQIMPATGVAHRTSPTNIGLMACVICAARRMGFVTFGEMLSRLEAMFNALDHLERWKGHFLNWYDTRTLAPLKPRYVSTVDSGNLAGYLLVCAQIAEEEIGETILSADQAKGIYDTVASYQPDGKYPGAGVLSSLQHAHDMGPGEFLMMLGDVGCTEERAKAFIDGWLQEMQRLFPWTLLLYEMPKELSVNEELTPEVQKLTTRLTNPLSIKIMVDAYGEILDDVSLVMKKLADASMEKDARRRCRHWLMQVERGLSESHTVAQRLYERLARIVQRAREIAMGMDFSALYVEDRDLFVIGYDLENGEPGDSYYDLFASEARLASFIAIAKGDVPKKHWFKLGRPLTLIGQSQTLLSWSGTMFEYLMPLLLMRDYDGTLLSETYRAVVAAQRQHGEQRRVPWGVSESAFFAFDLHQNYQYKAFGVPVLGLKRGLGKDVVISPYASVMAMMVDPEAAIRNLYALKEYGMFGEYGLYEALDLTGKRLSRRQRFRVIQSYMAHHQGMVFLSLFNVLQPNALHRYFHAVPMVRATELLLQEKMPGRKIYITEYQEKEDDGRTGRRIPAIPVVERAYDTPHTPVPELQLLSNGRYKAMITQAGGSFSALDGQAINRWRWDPTLEDHGVFLYLYDADTKDIWSAAYQPTKKDAEQYHVCFKPDRALVERSDFSVESRMEITVSPESDLEVRKLTLTNHSDKPRHLSVTSYLEPVLAPQEDERAHPAFMNLFIHTEWQPEQELVFVKRRSREPGRKPICMACWMVCEREEGRVEITTDRMEFVGRNRTLASPAGMEPGKPLSGRTGWVLDPCVAIRRDVTVPPGEPVRLFFMIAAGKEKEAVLALAERHRSVAALAKVFELAWTHSQVEARYLGIEPAQSSQYQRLYSRLVYPGLCRSWADVRKNRRAQRDLWKFGISGDLPILLVTVSKVDEIEFVRNIFRAHEFLRMKGEPMDLVVLNAYGNSYEQPVREHIMDAVVGSHLRELANRPGGVFVIEKKNLEDEDTHLLRAAASLCLDAGAGGLQAQLRVEGIATAKTFCPLPKRKGKEFKTPPVQVPELVYYNGVGGFTRDGREYVMELGNGRTTPMPWSNVMANEDFGTLVTESGGGHTWCKNSRENQLTPWRNDPVTDPPGEILYIREEGSPYPFCLTPAPIPDENASIVRHGQGYSVFQKNRDGLELSETIYVPIDAPVKIAILTIHNLLDQPRELEAVYFAEWVLGSNRRKTAPHLLSGWDDEGKMLYACNLFDHETEGKVAFLAATHGYAYSADRAGFLGRNGEKARPAFVVDNGFRLHCDMHMDPSAVVSQPILLPPQDTIRAVFVLGQAQDIDTARRLASLWRDPIQAGLGFNKVKKYWDDLLGTVQLKTPDYAMDLMLNRWLLYQTLACRYWGRGGFYQAGGAYGFRDQLQDILALLHAAPRITREHIRRCCRHQYPEGDVQHWWHEPYRGLRTRITDDRLFLPYAVSEYIRMTGDRSILDDTEPYLRDKPLRPDEKIRYHPVAVGREKEDIYAHCIRALDASLATGTHGLPLMGAGDWNDGMDRIGIEGQGESVWLGWFLMYCLNAFIPFCEGRGDMERAAQYREKILSVYEAIEINGWDGAWYLRAYDDDGNVVGGAKEDQCRITALPQAWAVLTHAADERRSVQAMDAVRHHLVCRDEGLIRLLWPPFENPKRDPGYIAGYPPGVRENGGQYTHGVLWVIAAAAELDQREQAWELFSMLNPVNHARTPLETGRYRVEPYVTSADVYTNPDHLGRGGWTWYTGSAAWMYRVGLEWILGFRREGDRLTMKPCIPVDWPGYEIAYRYGRTRYHIQVINGEGKSPCRVQLDGVDREQDFIMLKDDGRDHSVIFRM
jgi:cyclic beta-1,2-glucan synthetase